MNAFYSVSSAIAELTYIGCQVAVLVVVATVVKRHRPDAYRGLLAWAIGALAAGVVFTAIYPLMSVVGSAAGIESYMTVLGVIALVRAGVEVALVLVLVKGLAALAQPPKPPVVPSAGTYR